MLDSWGKPGPGLLNFNFQWLGNFEECIAIKSASINNPSFDHTTEFNGQYCTLGASISTSANPAAQQGNTTHQ